VDLNLVAAAVLRLHESSAERKQLELATDFQEPLPPACGDASLTYQALMNFVSNAVKFSPAGAKIWVRTAANADRIRVSVIDAGPGVPPAEREQLFREDVRLSPRPTGGEESHGLGLAIVKHLVEAQDGKVGADFPAGGGSVFWFELPGDNAAVEQRA
jgi:signal transduction histidine kinase